MNKLEALKELRKRISEQKELANGEYFVENEENNSCNMCVVGDLLNIGGATFEDLISIDHGKYDSGDYSIGTVIDTAYDPLYIERNNFVKEIFDELGFIFSDGTATEDEKMLKALQRANDDSGGDVAYVLRARPIYYSVGGKRKCLNTWIFILKAEIWSGSPIPQRAGNLMVKSSRIPSCWQYLHC